MEDGTIEKFKIENERLLKEEFSGKVENFILYYTSDDKERERMFEVLKDFMNEVYED